MSLSNDNVAKIAGKESSSVVRKIHNMPWLKQATPPKNSELGERTNGKMFNALASVNDDNQVVVEKKHKRGGSKKKKRNVTDISKKIDMKITTAQGQGQGQLGAGNSAWSTDKNAAEALFPNASESVASTQLSEEEQLEIALTASLETAFLEKCAADPPKGADDTDEAGERSDDDFWDGVHQNLPSSTSEESVRMSDPNNNSGASKKTMTSSVAAKPVPCTVASSKEANTSENEQPGSKAEKFGPIIPLDVPITPAIVPKFIDRFGRPDGRNEQHLFMGKGGRMKEENYRKNLQHGIVDDSSVTKSGSVSSQDATCYPTTVEPAKTNRRTEDSESANKATEKPRPIADSQDSQHEANAVAVDKSSHNENSGAANKSNDKKSSNARVQDPQRPKSVYIPGDNSCSDSYRAADKTNEKNRPNVGSQDSQRPTSVLGSRDNLRNDSQRAGDKSHEKNRHNGGFQEAQRSRNSAENNPHNDRSQRSSRDRPNPDVRYRYTEPFNASRNPHSEPFNASRNPHPEPYNASKNRYKYVKESNDGNCENRDRRNSNKSNGERDSRSTAKEFCDNNAEKNIPALFATKVERPPDAATVAKESKEPIDRAIIEKPSTSSTIPKPDVCQMETKELPPDLPKPTVQITDFNSRYSSSQEQILLPTYPTSASSSTKACFNDQMPSYSEIYGAYCQKSEPPVNLPSYSAPPPGFHYLEPAQHSCASPAYVLPVDATLSSSVYAPVESSRTASAYVSPQDRRSKIFSDDALMEAVYVSLKTNDPNLYNFLLQKEQQLQLLEQKNSIARAAAYAKIPAETCSEISASQRSYQEPQTLVKEDFPAEHRAQGAIPMNPNAKQFSPPPSQADAAMAYGYSAAANYELQPAVPFCPSVPPPQTVRRPQDVSAWTSAAGTNPYLHSDQAPQHQQFHQHHRHFSNANDSPTPTAILGRQNYLVSLQNDPYQNAQRPMNLQPLNDDYPRCQSSGFENIQNGTQRQVPYQALPPACGGVPNPFSLTHSAMCGAPNRPGTSRCGCSPPTVPLQSYADFIAKFDSTRLDVKQETDAPQGWSTYDASRNNQAKHQFVQPIIRPSSFNELQQLPSQGRGRARIPSNK